MTVSVRARSPITAQGTSIEEREGTDGHTGRLPGGGQLPGAAGICGTTHKTVRRVVEAHEAGSAGQGQPARKDRDKNYDGMRVLVAGPGREVVRPDLGQAAASGREGSGV